MLRASAQAHERISKVRFRYYIRVYRIYLHNNKYLKN